MRIYYRWWCSWGFQRQDKHFCASPGRALIFVSLHPVKHLLLCPIESEAVSPDTLSKSTLPHSGSQFESLANVYRVLIIIFQGSVPKPLPSIAIQHPLPPPGPATLGALWANAASYLSPPRPPPISPLTGIMNCALNRVLLFHYDFSWNVADERAEYEFNCTRNFPWAPSAASSVKYQRPPLI